MRCFDAHIHAGLRANDALDDMRYFGVEGCLTSANDLGREASIGGIVNVLRPLERELDAEIPRLIEHGFEAVAAVGIHPRSSPERGWEPVLRRLDLLLTRPEVRALGEVGLYDGTAIERELLGRQLRLAQSRDLPVLVGSPAEHRDEWIFETVDLLGELGARPARTLVDHLDETTLGPILAKGYRAGLSIHRDQLSTLEAAALVARYAPRYPGALSLNTAIEAGGVDPVALPRVGARLRVLGVDEAIIRGVCGDNARALLGLDCAEDERAESDTAIRSSA